MASAFIVSAPRASFRLAWFFAASVSLAMNMGWQPIVRQLDKHDRHDADDDDADRWR